MARRSRVDSVTRKNTEVASPPRTTKPTPLISDAQKLGILAVAVVLGVLFGTSTSSYLSARQLSEANVAIREQALAEHRAALETQEVAEQAISSGVADANGTSGLPPKWQLVIEKVLAFATDPCSDSSLVTQCTL